MKQKEFDDTLAQLDSNCNRIMGYKNDNLYARGTEDRLHNFKIGAEISGMTPAQIAWGYMTKHTAALRDMVLRNDFSNQDELEEKCTDIINYIRFIYCIGREAYKQESKRATENQAVLYADDIKYTTDPEHPEATIPGCPPYRAMNASSKNVAKIVTEGDYNYD